jgi:hypothetical protein
VSLRRGRQRRHAAHVELRSVVHDLSNPAGVDVDSTVAVGDHCVGRPAVPELARHDDEFLGALVAVGVVEEPAPAEILAGERVRRGDHVPAGATVRQVVEGGELPCHFEWFVERGVDGAGQAQPVGDGSQRSEDGEGVGTADHIQIVDAAAVLAQSQTLGEEEEVEQSALRRSREMNERVELDLTARIRVRPQPEALAQCFAVGVCGAEAACPLQQRHHLVDNHWQIGGVDRGPQPDAVNAKLLPPQDHVDEFGWGAIAYERIATGVDDATEGDVEVGVHLRACDLSQNRLQRVVVVRRDEDQIGTARGELVDRRRVGQGGDHGLTLRRARGDRGALDREVLADEVDVVQLVAVTNRPVATSRMTASSSHLSQSRRTTSTASEASSNRSTPPMSRRPNRSASCEVPLTRTCQPARPCDMKSSVAMAFETWNGSAWVTVATGISPMWFVVGATLEATRTASGRPASQRGSISRRRRR